MPDQVTRLPVELSAEWMLKSLMTDPPRLMPHEEWRLSIRLAADAPLRVAVLPYEVSWGLWHEHPNELLVLPLQFFSYDWPTTNEMQLRFGWRRVRMTDRELKTNPRAPPTLLLPESTMTGEVIPVCEVTGHDITGAVFAAAERDTETRRRHRWHVRPELMEALTPELGSFAGGEQIGASQRQPGA